MSSRPASVLPVLPVLPIASVVPVVPAAAQPAAVDVQLHHGRRLTLVASAGDDLVEVRGAGGLLELRIRMTADGPVLQMESLKLSLKAAQDVDVQCASFAVHASDGVALQADGDVRINGRLIHLN